MLKKAPVHRLHADKGGALPAFACIVERRLCSDGQERIPLGIPS
jgi:hypothetical protein